MNEASLASSDRPGAWWSPAVAGCRGVSWQTFALILLINTGIAGLLYIDETRPFWHPFITAQCYGLSIAYAVNGAGPWERAHPIGRLALAVAAGTVLGTVFLIAIKGYVIGAEGYVFGKPMEWSRFGWTMMSAYVLGLCVSVFFLVKFRETRVRAQMLRADAERAVLSKQAIEAELKLMQ